MNSYVKKNGITSINQQMFKLLQNKIIDDYKIELNDKQIYYLQSMIDCYLKITLNNLQY